MACWPPTQVSPLPAPSAHGTSDLILSPVTMALGQMVVAISHPGCTRGHGSAHPRAAGRSPSPTGALTANKTQPGSPADLGDGPCPGPVFANTCRCVCVRPPVWTPTGGPWPHLDRGWSARVRVTSAWLCPMSPIASGLWSSAGVPLSSPMSGCPPWYAHGSVSLSVRTGCPCLHRRLSPCPQGDTRFPDTRLHETSPFLFSCIAVDWV